MTRSWLGLVLIMSLAAVGASAQSGITNLAMTLVGTGGGVGKPGIVDAHFDRGLFTVSYSVTDPVNKFTTMYANSPPLSFTGIDGGMTDTNIVLLFAGNGNDGVRFKDTDPHLRDNGRNGTASVAWGSGAFNGATGTITYNLTCTSLCFTGQGTPVAGLFGFNFSASGTLDLQTAKAQNFTPQASTDPPAPNSINTFVAKQPNSTGGKIRRANADPAASSSSGGGDSFSMAVPWQLVESSFSATSTCPTLSTGCWITIPTGSGSIAPFTDASVEVDINSGDLGTGVYPANLSFTLTPTVGGGAPATQNLPFTLIVTTGAPLLQLSEMGIQFQAVAGAQQSPPAHTIALTSSGTAIPYTATASTLTGGNWLTVTPASGSASSPSVTGTVSIAANPAGLAAGSYFGRVAIGAPHAFEAQQSVEVVLTVTAATDAPLLSTTGVIFVTPENTNPAPQLVTVSTFSSTPITVNGKAGADNMATWISGVASSTMLQSGQPIIETLFVNTKGLAPGVYTGRLYEIVTATGAEFPVNVLLIVTPPSGTACTPTRLLPVMTNLGTNFEFPAGLPVSLQAEVVDDCGSPLNAGGVQASFASGDSAAVMTPLGNGQWSGTWQPHGIAGGPALVAVRAVSDSGLQGATSVVGTVDANTAATVVNQGGTVNAASLVSGAPVSPGEFISIFGFNLAPSTARSNSLPLETTLAGTQVLLDGQPLPLDFVSSGQINAVMPYSTPVNGIQELVVKQNGVYSLPEALVVATANPAVFTQDSSGQGAGVIVVVKADGRQFTASASQPASAGDSLVIYCAGLGPVNPAIADGMGAPPSPHSNTVNLVTVTIGGQNAQVKFAGLAPGFAGLYQVNVVVPPGTTAGANVPVVLTTAGFSSAPVTVAIK
jgi:uncharacterized protein (TIGR03437 family)